MSQTAIQDWKAWDMYDEIVSSVENVHNDLIVPTKQINYIQQNIIQHEENIDSSLSPFFAIGEITAYENEPQEEYKDIEEETMACMQAVQGI